MGSLRKRTIAFSALAFISILWYCYYLRAFIISVSVQYGDAELCCICFEQVCTIEVQKCGHQMCANCTLALCCHSKPNSSSAKIPVCPFCRSSITQLAIAQTKPEDEGETEVELKPRRTRKSVNLGESSSFKSFSSLGSFGRLGFGLGKVGAECNGELDKSFEVMSWERWINDQK